MEDIGTLDLTNDELVDGLGTHGWMCVAATMGKMRASKPTSELGKYIRERDLSFVATYAKTAPTGTE